MYRDSSTDGSTLYYFKPLWRQNSESSIKPTIENWKTLSYSTRENIYILNHEYNTMKEKKSVIATRGKNQKKVSKK